MFRHSIFDNPLVWVVGGALVSMWLHGTLHAYTAHGGVDAVAALILPPYGVYMSSEDMFGHSGR